MKKYSYGFYSNTFFMSINRTNIRQLKTALYSVLCEHMINIKKLTLQEPTRSEMARVLEEQQLNVGHGLAWSFYFGYLRLIIPGIYMYLFFIFQYSRHGLPSILLLLPCFNACAFCSLYSHSRISNLTGLQARIWSWEPSIQTTKRHKVIPKLYILVPKSCYCPPSITAADPRLKVAGVTPSFVANRAGNQLREYKNTMYCFEADNVVCFLICTLSV